jgi:hypothetical protein
MKAIQRIIYTGFATAALASASVPALAWSPAPDIDFAWYANVGKPLAGPTLEVYPAPRAGHIWSPGHWETRGSGQEWVDGQWIVDDYPRQFATPGAQTPMADGAPQIRDRDGNVIPTDPNAYPIDSTRR